MNSTTQETAPETQVFLLNGVLFVGTPLPLHPRPAAAETDPLLAALAWPMGSEVWSGVRLAVTDTLVATVVVGVGAVDQRIPDRAHEPSPH